MTKAKKTGKEEAEKKKSPSKAASSKEKTKTEAKDKVTAPKAGKTGKTEAKPAAKSAPDKKAATKPAKKTEPTKTVKKEKPASAKAAQPAKKTATSSKAKSATGKVEKLSQPAKAAAPAPVKPKVVVAGFSNAGLAVKTSSGKPGLSIAPGVMILGKTTVAKTENPEKAAERKLSKKELADIRTFLLEKRERLLAGMRRELAVQRERSESKAADEVDKATDAYDEDLSYEIAAANDQELSEIQVALEKIDKGTYGECEICGCTISPSRLKILPSATTCVSCRGQEELARRRDDGILLFSMMSGDDGEQEPGDI